MNLAKVELGRWLFYDTRLSGNQTMSCATCHIQALAFTDGKARSIGSTGVVHPRSSMSLVNAAYASRLTWANPLLAILNGLRAISAFVRTILGYDSRYDRYLRDDTTALSESEERGMELFFSERLECFHCHGGFNFTDSTTHADSRVDRVGFHNTGLYNLDGEGAYPVDNTGLFDMTGERRDMGRFRAPSLRNVAVTAPYMHDGSIPTLEEVIAHYERGGRLLEEGPFAGDGRLSPFKSEFVTGFELDNQERDDLLAFLESLTDESLLYDQRFSDPFLN